jgi:hypothetical protein
MLVECGFTRATTADSVEFTFQPSFGRIATLGDPLAIVRLYAGLYGPRAADEARYVLIGWVDEDLVLHAGAMPAIEQIILARHLMQHGICGKAKPTDSVGSGKFSDRFEAAEFVSAARVHLGLSSADAEALSMTEFQTMLDMKFPDKNKRDVPSKAEYDAAWKRIEERANV